MINNSELINKIKSYNKFLNPETLTKAYDFALKAHKTQKRDEGVPYIIHPVAVADILSDLKLDSATITTGLLHDTIEDTKALNDLDLEMPISLEKIKKNYKKLVKIFHPDVNGNNKKAEEKFKQINESYKLLLKKFIKQNGNKT